MRKAYISVNGIKTGTLKELDVENISLRNLTRSTSQAVEFLITEIRRLLR